MKRTGKGARGAGQKENGGGGGRKFEQLEGGLDWA